MEKPKFLSTDDIRISEEGNIFCFVFLFVEAGFDFVSLTNLKLSL